MMQRFFWKVTYSSTFEVYYIYPVSIYVIVIMSKGVNVAVSKV
jgi:hypothetical protein